MRYLITGGAGFVGSHLAELLLKNGHEVLALDNLSTGSYDNVSSIDDRKRFQLIVDSVNNEKAVRYCVKSVDAVFHLASAVGVKLILMEPVKTIESIVGGTEVVLGECSRLRRPVLLTSTSEVYGKGVKIPFNEEDDRTMGATTKRRWSYACAKAVDEFLALAHWYQSKLPIFIARLFNTVGPRQTGQYGMVIPRFVTQALRNEPITVYGDGKQQRCFAHVVDVVEALYKLIQSPHAAGEVVNVGNDEEISIGKLAERILKIAGSRSPIEYISYDKAYGEGFDDMMRRVPDLTKIQGMINYRPRFSLDDIISDVIDYECKRMETGIRLRVAAT